MKIVKVGVRIERTFNLGNYSNVTPCVELEAELESADYLDTVINQLEVQCMEQIKEIIDHELMRQGDKPHYQRQKTYQIYYSKLRDTFAIVLDSVTVKYEDNWKHNDDWKLYTAHLFFHPDDATQHLRELHHVNEIPFQSKVTEVKEASDFPPLPDPGLEPMWSKKRLKRLLEHLHVPKDLWIQIGELEYVNDNYLQQVRDEYNRDNIKTREEALSVILENKPLKLEIALVDDDEADDIPI